MMGSVVMKTTKKVEPADNVIPSQGLRLWFYDSAPLPHYWARRTRLGDSEIRIWSSMSPLMDGYCKEVRGWRADMENFYRLSKQWMAATNKEWDSSPHLNIHTHTSGLYFLPPSVQASGLPGRSFSSESSNKWKWPNILFSDV